MAFAPQDDDTNDSGLEPGTTSRAHKALTALVRVLAREAAREFLCQAEDHAPGKAKHSNEGNAND